MKTRILIHISIIAVAMFGTAKEAAAQGKAIYFMKDGKVTYSQEIANIDSIIFAPPVLPTLSVTPTALSFTKEATESYEVVVATNQQPWDATSNQTWCTITKGTNQFTVTATTNTGTNRTATITVTAGKATPKTISVTQVGFNWEDEISMSNNKTWYISGGTTATGVITLNVRNYLGEVPLRIAAGGQSYNKTIYVQANSRYTIQVKVVCTVYNWGTPIAYPIAVTVYAGNKELSLGNISYLSSSTPYVDSVYLGDPVLQ